MDKAKTKHNVVYEVTNCNYSKCMLNHVDLEIKNKC